MYLAKFTTKSQGAIQQTEKDFLDLYGLFIIKNLKSTPENFARTSEASVNQKSPYKSPHTISTALDAHSW